MKKFPLALPVCLYCTQKFGYKEVMKSKGKEDIICPKCNQNFKVALETTFSILIACIVVIVMVINVCLGLFLPGMNVFYMMGVMAVGIIAGVTMLPLVIRYIKPENMKYSTRTTRFKR